MHDTRNHFLIAASVLSALAALAHLGCIAFGPTWYRFFGAGERMARMAASGSWYPTVVTLVIAAVLTAWALYALSGARVIPRLPLTRAILCIVTSVYLLRGLAILPIAALHPGRGPAFWFWSSAICMGIGIVHLVGIRQAWLQI